MASKKLSLEFGTKHLAKGAGRSHNVMMASGKGSYLTDVNGKKYLDLTMGIGVCNLGHCYPPVVDACCKQMKTLTHGQTAYGFHQPLLEMMHNLKQVMPSKTLNSFHFRSSGAEAVEAAMMLCRHATKRPVNIALQGGFHGRTIGTLSLTSSRSGYGVGLKPFMPGVLFAPIPYPTQLGIDPTTPQEQVVEHCLHALRVQLNQHTSAQEVSMILAEPVVGEGGYFPLPGSYLRGLRKICDEHGILLVIDEVQSGFGRTGTIFNIEQAKVVPDVLVFAKGFANGLPISGIATRQELSDTQPVGSMGGTYGPNAVASTAANAVMKTFLKDNMVLDNVAKRSQQFVSGLLGMVKKNGFPVREVRGAGLMVAVEFDLDAPKGSATAVSKAAYDRGTIVSNTSMFDTLRLIPSLLITKKETDEALSVLEDSMTQVFKKDNKKATRKHTKYVKMHNPKSDGKHAFRIVNVKK